LRIKAEWKKSGGVNGKNSNIADIAEFKKRSNADYARACPQNRYNIGYSFYAFCRLDCPEK
jgi:hypothetical protein